MLLIRDPTFAKLVTDPSIRRLVEQRFEEVCADEPWDYDTHGYFIVVEPGDSVADLEAETSSAILHDLFNDAPYGDPDYAPSFEALEEHHAADGTIFFEMLFITSDSGFGITVFVPKTDKIDSRLLAMCTEYAEPASEVTQP